jgi:signal peptidase I
MTGQTTSGGAAAPRSLIREWAPVLGFLLLVLVARSTLADHYHVPSGSMEPSLMPGDHVLVDKAAYGYRFPFTQHVLWPGEAPRSGDVVIFDSPVDGVRLIKRVVAVAGDVVAVRNGRVWINGEPRWEQGGISGESLVERYDSRRIPLNLGAGGGPKLPPIEVPAGQVLVLGDHRGNSRDGRFFGFIPAASLYGKAQGVIWRRGAGPVWRGL